VATVPVTVPVGSALNQHALLATSCIVDRNNLYIRRIPRLEPE